MICCCPKPTIINEEIQCCFKKSCKRIGILELLWKAKPGILNPFGTLVINFQKGCNLLEVWVNGVKIPDGVIRRGQSFCRTFDDLRKVEIKCIKDCDECPEFCCGIMCLSLHYEINKC